MPAETGSKSPKSALKRPAQGPHIPTKAEASLAATMEKLNIQRKSPSPSSSAGPSRRGSPKKVRFARIEEDQRIAELEEQDLGDLGSEEANISEMREREWDRIERLTETVHLTATTEAMRVKYPGLFDTPDENPVSRRAKQHTRKGMYNTQNVNQDKADRMNCSTDNSWAAQDRRENKVLERDFAYAASDPLHKDSRWSSEELDL